MLAYFARFGKQIFGFFKYVMLLMIGCYFPQDFAHLLSFLWFLTWIEGNFMFYQFSSLFFVFCSNNWYFLCFASPFGARANFLDFSRLFLCIGWIWNWIVVLALFVSDYQLLCVCLFFFLGDRVLFQFIHLEI